MRGADRCWTKPMLGAAVAAAVALSGCHGSKPGPAVTTPATPRPSPSATPSVDPTRAAATTDILAAFNGYRTAESQANTSGTATPTQELQKYLGDPLLTQVVAGLQQNRTKGVYYTGNVTTDPKVTDVRLGDQPPSGTIRSCEDYANYRLVYRSNNSPVPVPPANRRFMVTYTATLVTGQGWRITNASSDRSQTC